MYFVCENIYKTPLSPYCNFHKPGIDRILTMILDGDLNLAKASLIFFGFRIIGRKYSTYIVLSVKSLKDLTEVN